MSNCYNELLSTFNNLPLPMDCINIIKEYTYVFDCKCNFHCFCTDELNTLCEDVDLSNLKKEIEKYQHCKNLKIPFGKHKGKYYLSLPDDYLNWLETKGILKGDINEFLKLTRKINKTLSAIHYRRNPTYH